MLNTVRTPSAARTGADGFHRRVVVRRKQEREAGASSSAAAACSSSGNSRPSASSTSALPHKLDTERLPCLTTRAPAAAARSAAPVERFKLPEPSPPVPTMSTQSALSAMAGLRASCAWPRRTREFLVRGRFALGPQRRQHRTGQRRRHVVGGQRDQQLMRLRFVEIGPRKQQLEQIAHRHPPAASAPALQALHAKNWPSIRSLRCQDAFRMKLHALDRQASMAHPHDLARLGARRDLQHGRQLRRSTASEW